MRYAYAALTDVGRLRQNNEDAVLVDAELSLAVLADGMGGYLAGEVASSMAIEHIRDAMRDWREAQSVEPSLREWRRAVEAAVDQANQAIFERAYTDSACAGMGTTLVMAALTPDPRIVIAHAGDSRAYRWRAGELVQLTRDHSLLQEQIDAGLLTPEQARGAGYRNFITRALGIEDAMALDVADHAIEPGDLYLLCSDGLHDMVDDSRVADCLLAFDEPAAERLDACAHALIDQANARGGRDNISVILIKVLKAP